MHTRTPGCWGLDGSDSRPARGSTRRRTGGHRSGTVRRHAPRRSRRGRGPGGPARRRRPRDRPGLRRHQPEQALGAGRPQVRGRPRARAGPGRARRRADRGVPPRGRRAARRRPGRLPRPQPEAGLRPDDRVGPGGPALPHRRARHRVHRRHRGARHDRRPGRAPGRPGQPGRRLRGRLPLPRHRRPRRPPVRPHPRRLRPGRRRRDRRRHRPPHRHDPRHGRGRMAGRTGAEPTSSTAAAPSTAPTRPPTASTWRWARWSSSSTTPSWNSSASGTGPPPARTWPAGANCARRSPPASSPVRARSGRPSSWLRRLRGPVLSLREAPGHPHLAARATFTDFGGITQPAPAPRFSATPAAVASGPALPGAHTESVAADWDVPALLPKEV